jgi:hypothetical protein
MATVPSTREVSHVARDTALSASTTKISLTSLELIFFILASSRNYTIYHIDVYQGRTSSNVGIDPSLWNLPTTMKAVVNAVIQTNIRHGSDHVNGFWLISLDNRYQCPQLAYLLWHRYSSKSNTCILTWPNATNTLRIS